MQPALLGSGMTWYDVLGVMPGAEARKIKQKYDAKAALLRPELISGAPPDMLTAVTRAQELLDTAREVLGDPESRRRYDEAVGLRRSGGGLGQPGTGIESAGLAPADPGITGELSGNAAGALLALTGWLGPRRRRNSPSPSRTSAGCSTTRAWRWRPGAGFTSGSSGSLSARWRSTGWWSIKIPGRRRRRIAATRSPCSSGTRLPGRADRSNAVLTRGSQHNRKESKSAKALGRHGRRGMSDNLYSRQVMGSGLLTWSEIWCDVENSKSFRSKPRPSHFPRSQTQGCISFT